MTFMYMIVLIVALLVVAVGIVGVVLALRDDTGEQDANSADGQATDGCDCSFGSDG